MDQLNNTTSAAAEASAQLQLSSFKVDSGGVYCSENNKWKRIASTIKVLAKTRDENSQDWGRLLEVIDPDNVSHKWAMPNSLLRNDGAEMRGELLRLGAEIEPGRENHNLLTKYIQSESPATRARCVSRTGWFQNVFVLPDKTVGKTDELIIYQSSTATTSPVKQSGTVEEWRTSIGNLCKDNSRLITAVCASLSAPLLGLLGEQSDGINFRGQSSIGKTITLQVGASVFGVPREFVKTWRATGNAIESIARNHNCLPLPLDELAEVDPREIGSTIYMLMNGKPKGRLTKDCNLRQEDGWTIALMSSAEVSLAQLMREDDKKTRAGQEVRFVDIEADAGKGYGVFEDLHDHQDSKAFAETIKTNSSRYFGAIGARYLEALVGNQDHWCKTAKKLIKEFEATYADYSNQVRRVVKQFAIKAAAGEIASMMSLTGWNKGEATAGCRECLDNWIENQGQADNLEENEIIDQVTRFLEQHGNSRFEPIGKDSNQKTYNRAGFANYNNGTLLEYWVLPQAFKTELCKGFDVKEVVRVLATRGILMSDSANKNQVNKRTSEGQRRVYCLQADRLS